MPRIDKLRELEQSLVSRMECAETREFAALARQYRETIREIDEIENGEDADDRAAQLVKRHRKPEQPDSD